MLDYDPSRIFEPVAYREIAAEAMRTYMQEREMSPDVTVRDGSHFEGKLTPQEFNRAITRAISAEDEAIMREMGYRILEFGRFHWGDVVEALTVYRRVHGNSDVPIDYVITDELVQEGQGYSEGSEGLLLGEAVAGIRLGDIDGLEDEDRCVWLPGTGAQSPILTLYSLIYQLNYFAYSPQIRAAGGARLRVGRYVCAPALPLRAAYHGPASVPAPQRLRHARLRLPR